MAGGLKPDDSLLTYKEQSIIEILEYNEESFYSSTSPLGLIEGNSYDGYTSSDVCYFYQNDAYFKFKVDSICNIWIISTDGNIAETPNAILKDSTGKDITNLFCNIKNQTYSTNNWHEYITNLPMGEYYIYNNGAKIVWGEWYAEKVKPKYLLYNKGHTYVLNEENYNSDTGMYNEISEIPSFDNMECDSLTDTPEYLRGLRPIDKFDDDIQLIYNDSSQHSIDGIKSTRELIVANGDINNGIADVINNISLTYQKSNDSVIKLAISTDKGNSWKTFDNCNWINLDVSIPSNNYDSLSNEEKIQWENAKNKIYEEGIDCTELKNIDFNSLTNDGNPPETIRFAYVLENTYDNECSTTELKWDFNAKGNMDMMYPGVDYKVSVYEKEVTVTSLIDTSLIKVNLLV